jgi:hypothetical protein
MTELRWAVALTERENATVDSLCNKHIIISSCAGLIRVNQGNEVTFVRQYSYLYLALSPVCLTSLFY